MFHPTLQMGLLFRPHPHRIGAKFMQDLALAGMNKGLQAVNDFIHFVAIFEGYGLQGVHDDLESFSEVYPNIKAQI